MKDLYYEDTASGVVWKEIVSWVKVIVFAILAAYLINSFVLVNAQVPTGSMEDTILPGDRIVAFRLSYLFSEPERFDIVVFKFPDDESTLFVKRIIGLPGDSINIINGKVYINDSEEPLDDSFVKGIPYGNFGPYTVPDGSYFMMGDNRNYSSDSREWVTTYVTQDKILGKALFGYYPKPKMLN